MSCQSSVLLALLLLSSASAASPNPVSRVAQLLKDLASKIDSELSTEERLYEDFACWAKTVISTKTASNEKAQTRVDSLKTYLADLDAGRIELTSERSDLEKEIAGLNKDLETAAALRSKEHDDYLAATTEIDQAVKAVNSAIKVLDEATKSSKSKSLVSFRARISQSTIANENEGFSTRLEEANELERAVSVGSRYLSQGDALFLRRLLSADVPHVDSKKLNRKADFKMKYKARSEKIQGTLAKLLQNFKDAKDDAEAKEKDAKDRYDLLTKAKEAQLNSAQESLSKQDLENGAAGVSKQDAKSEIDSLESQIKDDTKYISETETALEDKKKEFAERKNLRVGEIKAINEAIAVIHSDDARDLFKRSVSLVQLDTVSALAGAQAAAVIRETARTSGDMRLDVLLARVGLQSGAKFDKVIAAVDKMMKTLEDEHDEDKANKEECEKNRATDTREAAELSRTIDELSDDVVKLEGEIKQINDEVAEKEQHVKDLNKEIQDAKKIRQDEHAEWKQSNSDDTAAIELLEKSAGVLKNLYKDNFSMMQQKHFMRDAPQVSAGKAPPPPPKTWEGGYGGAQKESNGIVSILEVIKADVEKDQIAGKAAEDAAQKDHDKFVTESEGSIKKLDNAINDLNASKGRKEKDVESTKETSVNKKGLLDAVVQKMKDATKGCDFLLVNLKVRADNRNMEIDGLRKAKTILQSQNK